jgi:DNA mismatch repair protein MutS
MMEQYRSIRKGLSEDTVLFFHLGDFYEMFFEDAIRASEILGITLTGRDGGPVGRVPMCGIPTRAFQQYVRVLLDRNLKVAICEQIGDPHAAKGLVERKVTRIISPATYLDDGEKRSSPEYMVAVAQDHAICALAALDLGTGEFFVREVGRDRWSHELTLLRPREVILSRALEGSPTMVSFLKESVGASVTVYDDWVFEPTEAIRFLKEGFRLASERGIAFHDRPVAISASGAILYYLKDHLHSALEHIGLPILRKAHEFMVLDRQTLRNLELVSSLSGDNRAGTLLSCIDSTLTPMGGRVLTGWVTHPLLTLVEIQTRQEAVAELVGDPLLAQALSSSMKGVKDVERILSRLNVGVGNARDLLHLRFFLDRVPEIGAHLEKARSGILQGLRKILIHDAPPSSPVAPSSRPAELPAGAAGPSSPIDEEGREADSGRPEGDWVPAALSELIGRAMVEMPPLTVREGGLIRDGYSRELDELRRIAAQGKSWLSDFQRRESERTGIRSLRIRASQVFGYTIEVSRANLHLVPAEYVRRQTLANAERFIVPELRRWDEQISGAQERIKALEHRLFQEVRGEVLKALTPLQAMARAVGTLDVLVALAWTAIRKQWVRPSMTDSRELMIKGGRHPVVEAMLPAGQFVENDTLLNDSDHQLVVLTGPNMAGKSTTIRQVAQIVLLSQIGSFIPATSARIGLVDRIFTRIGAADDLARGESTFMVEMVEMAQILQMATDRSLLILDEIGRGTSTFDGVSLAWAICEQLVRGPVRPRTLFATHYHELTQLEAEFAGIKNYTITVKETPEGILFLRKVVRGGSDRSYGIHVARLAGIPKAVTDRAAQILRILESENAEATRMIESRCARPSLSAGYPEERMVGDASEQVSWPSARRAEGRRATGKEHTFGDGREEVSAPVDEARRAEEEQVPLPPLPPVFSTRGRQGESARGSAKPMGRGVRSEGEGKGHLVVEEIRDLEIDGVTPLQALNKLAEWKRLLRGE